MNAGMEFPAEAVLRHAGAVDEAADEMSTARAAAGDVAVDTQAYGQLCQFLPGLLNPLLDSAVDVLSQAVESLGETALSLRSTAEDMTSTDAGSARRLDAATSPHVELPL